MYVAGQRNLGVYYSCTIDLIIEVLQFYWKGWRQKLTCSRQVAFVKQHVKLYDACLFVQGREAELEMQQSHGHGTGKPEDFQNKVNTVWLWARDKLTDQLKSAAK